MQNTSCIGIDGFNQCLSGTKSPTLMCQRTDYKNVPSVLIREPIVLESNQNHATITQSGICTTLVSSMGDGGGYIPMVCYSIDEKMGQTYIHKDVANTLAARDYKQPQAVIYGKDNT